MPFTATAACDVEPPFAASSASAPRIIGISAGVGFSSISRAPSASPSATPENSSRSDSSKAAWPLNAPPHTPIPVVAGGPGSSNELTPSCRLVVAVRACRMLSTPRSTVNSTSTSVPRAIRIRVPMWSMRRSSIGISLRSRPMGSNESAAVSPPTRSSPEAENLMSPVSWRSPSRVTNVCGTTPVSE